MSLLHLSMAARDPEMVAGVLARILGGPALPFPPCDGAWIVFCASDDGSAVELYPAGARIEAGPETIRFRTGAPEAGPVASHVALSTALPADDVLAIGADVGWQTRVCDRGPFRCVELWVENRFLVEVLDPAMQDDYRAGMTAASWRSMFGLGGK